MSIATTTRMTVGDVELAVTEAGRGGHPLLLVHGFTGAKEDFRDAVAPLAEDGHWVVAPDLRGHGDSSHPPQESDYGLERFAADLGGLVDALGWTGFSLLGHSMGGMVAQLLALSRPGAVDALVLMDTSHGPVRDLDGDLLAMGLEVCRSSGLATILEVLKMGDGVLETPAHRRMVAEVPGWEEWEDAKFLACSPAMWCAVVEQLPVMADRLAALSGLDLPALVVVGEQDEPFLAPSRALADALPAGRLVVVPDAGHSPQFENRAAWESAVRGFLSEALGPLV